MSQLTDDPTYNSACKIINNSSKDIIILDAADLTEDVDNEVPELLYEQTLVKLKLNGGDDTILKAGSTGIVTLNDTWVDDKKQTQVSYCYNLILANSNDLSPVKVVAELYSFGDSTLDPPIPDSYPDIEVEAKDATEMAKAIQFLQVINAYPSSNLAKAFVAALKSTDSEATTADVEKVVNQFFQGTTGYKEVTFNDYVTVSTYESTFATSWYPPSTDVPFNTDHTIPAHTEYSYWLYSAANMGGGNGGASKASCLGKVMFLNGPSNDPSDHNSGMQVYFTKNWWIQPAASDTPLHFDKGQFVDQITDVPGITLQAIWALKGPFTSDSIDTTIWPSVIGTVGGQDVIGIPMHAEDGWDKFADLWTELTFQSVLSHFLEIMGVLMAIDFIKTKVGERIRAAKEKKANENKEKDLSPEQEEEVKANADAVGNKAAANKQKVADRLGKDSSTGKPKVSVPDESGIGEAQTAETQGAIKAAKDRGADSAGNAMDKFQDQATELGEYANTQSLREAMSCLKDAHTAFTDARSTGDFSLVSQHLNDGQGYIKTLAEKLGNALSKEMKAAINTSELALQDFADTAKDVKDDIEDAETGEIPEEIIK